MQNQIKRHHPLDLNTLKGYGDSVTGLSFSSDGKSLATACGDRVVSVFKLDNVSSKSFKINLSPEGHPFAVTFADDASSIVVACHAMSGSYLYMYGEEEQKDQQGKLPLPEIKWEHHNIHEKRAVLTLSGATATYGNLLIIITHEPNLLIGYHSFDNSSKIALGNILKFRKNNW